MEMSQLLEHIKMWCRSDSGSAYVIDVTTGNQLRKLTASDTAAGDYFGFAVQLMENRAIIGAYGDDDAGSDLAQRMYLM
jgi:hypothetical protein